MRRLCLLMLMVGTLAQAHEAGFSRLDVKVDGDVIMLEWSFDHLNTEDLTQADLRSLMSLELDGRAFMPAEVVSQIESNGDLRLKSAISTVPESFTELGLRRPRPIAIRTQSANAPER